MSRIRPVRQAIRDGIGQRLIELGFGRKTERFYDKDEGDCYFWSSFVIDDHERCFREETGFRFRALERLIADVGLMEHVQYIFQDPSPYHAWISALGVLGWQDREAEDAYVDAFKRKAGPFRFFFDPRSKWRAQSPLLNAPYYEKGQWRVGDDPALCVAESLKAWRAHVEPWIAEMRDPKAFARQYRVGRMTPEHCGAAACAWMLADAPEHAAAILKPVYRRKDLTEAEAYARSKRYSRRFGRRLSEQEHRHRAEESVASARKESARAKEIADALGLRLDDE